MGNQMNYSEKHIPNYSEKHIPNCAGFIVVCNDCVLLVSTHKNVWGFPKGKRHTKELHIDCAYRELKEETGLTAKDITPLDIDTFWINELSNKGTPSVRLYIATTDKMIQPKIQDVDELASAKWVKVSDAGKILTLKNRFKLLQDAMLYIQSHVKI